MKILGILHFPPPYHGSAIIGGLIKESKILNTEFEIHYINFGTSKRVEEIGRNSLHKVTGYIKIIWQTVIQMIIFKPDLCYLTPNSKGIGFYKDALIILIVKLFRKPIIFHFHNKGVKSRQNRVIDNLLYKLTFNNSKVILLSKNIFPDIQRYVNENQVFYCPNGIPDLSADVIPYITRYSESKIDSPVEILFLSHLIKSKGIFELIEACEILINKKLQFRCTIAGGDAEFARAELSTLIESKDLTSVIKIVGAKSGTDKTDLMRNTDIFVHPTYNDCMPLVIIEAMQFSLPVVSTFEGAIPDLVDDGITGFLVAQKDAIALASRLEQLILDHDLRNSMGKAGRIKYEEEFTIDKFEHKLCGIFKMAGLKID